MYTKLPINLTSQKTLQCGDDRQVNSKLIKLVD